VRGAWPGMTDTEIIQPGGTPTKPPLEEEIWR